MLHPKILEKFELLFPSYGAILKEYIPNGKGSIRLKFNNLIGEYVFTYKDAWTWSFETRSNFMNRFCGRTK